MPRSLLLGRALPAPGEPLFLPEDTAAALALAEEERDTCNSCGFPKSVCRDGLGHPFTDYEVKEEVCQPTLRLGHYRAGVEWDKKHDVTKNATQLVAKFRDGKQPDITTGLKLD